MMIDLQLTCSFKKQIALLNSCKLLISLFLTGERAELLGLGKRVLLQNVTSDELCKAIDYVTGSEEVKRNMKELSAAVQKDDAMDRLCDVVIESCSKNSEI